MVFGQVGQDDLAVDVVGGQTHLPVEVPGIQAADLFAVVVR